VRALLRDVLCGYLDPDLKSVADDILLETPPEPFEIEARDLRRRPAPEHDTNEFEPVAAPTASHPPRPLEGVTQSDDWSSDPEDYSAPV
jgi:hypothetical protein